jgi:16S rRNA (cytosine1402-N4)-methyltransferase
MPRVNADEAKHEPVLVQEVLSLLDPRPGMTMLDCTVGRGGHAMAIIPKLIAEGRYIGLDVDPVNVEFARQRLANSPVRVDIVHSNFATAFGVLSQLDVDQVDLVLADVGFASSQMDDPSRGFSFSVDGPLDMRLDPSLPQSAADLINTLSEKELADVLFRYGDERYSRKIARKIVEKRAVEPIQSTGTLADLVRRVYGSSRERIDPATRTFMALRIAVNAELDALEQLLISLPSLVAVSAVVGVISFHSLEDRLVKRAFSKFERDGLATRLTAKPVTAGDAEISRNPRSRSAKLRAIRFTGS